MIATVVDDLWPHFEAYERSRSQSIFRECLASVEQRKKGGAFVAVMNTLRDFQELQDIYYTMQAFFSTRLSADDTWNVCFIMQSLFEGFHGWEN